MSAGRAGDVRRDENATSTPTVVLASASYGRLSVLRNAGIEPVVLVSGVDEDTVRAAHRGAEPAVVIQALAEAKAEAVARDYASDPALADAVVISGDSMLLIDGELQGKPHTAEQTRRRWSTQMGRSGDLITGHCVLRVVNGEVTASVSGTSFATVTIGSPDAAELDAYIATGEPLEVAGAFTIDGFGGWFVDSIQGDPSCVVGLALPLVRRLLGEVGVRVTDLWNKPTERSPESLRR